MSTDENRKSSHYDEISSAYDELLKNFAPRSRSGQTAVGKNKAPITTGEPKMPVKQFGSSEKKASSKEMTATQTRLAAQQQEAIRRQQAAKQAREESAKREAAALREKNEAIRRLTDNGSKSDGRKAGDVPQYNDSFIRNTANSAYSHNFGHEQVGYDERTGSKTHGNRPSNNSARKSGVTYTSASERTRYMPAQEPAVRKKANTNSSVPSQPRLTRKEKKRRYRKQKAMHGFLSLFVSIMIIIVVVLTSLALKIPIMGCVNDIIAIDRSDTPVTIVTTADMSTSDIVQLLEKNNLIYSEKFCLLFIEILHADEYNEDTRFIEGEHILTASMGIEGMLNSMISVTEDATVSITFPEGYTIDQIAEKLYTEGVIDAKNAFYNAIDSYEFTDTYAFLNTITNRELRYRVLEGFMYPDTYEFYVGENVNSVIDRFLTNFSDKWTSSYQTTADELGYTVDQIITIASIVQKEAKDANEMYTIASILFNRLHSDNFTTLQCDSTGEYITGVNDGSLTQTQIAELLERYDTYITDGLPVGPICNPGNDAIYATLHADDTSYYFFCHDKDGQVYYAKTADEHEINVAKTKY